MGGLLSQRAGLPASFWSLDAEDIDRHIRFVRIIGGLEGEVPARLRPGIGVDGIDVPSEIVAAGDHFGARRTGQLLIANAIGGDRYGVGDLLQSEGGGWAGIALVALRSSGALRSRVTLVPFGSSGSSGSRIALVPFVALGTGGSLIPLWTFGALRSGWALLALRPGGPLWPGRTGGSLWP